MSNVISLCEVCGEETTHGSVCEVCSKEGYWTDYNGNVHMLGKNTVESSDDYEGYFPDEVSKLFNNIPNDIE